MSIGRRDFMQSVLAGAVALSAPKGINAASVVADEKNSAGKATPPVLISAENASNYLDVGYSFLTSGGDTLDAVLKVVQGPENDPNDESVGLGGHPNEEGVVELDACCM